MPFVILHMILYRGIIIVKLYTYVYFTTKKREKGHERSFYEGCIPILRRNRGKRKGTPVNGDRCRIGTNAVIVGNVKIGSDVLIAPHTFVNSDVPDHRMVIGNPGRVILKKMLWKDIFAAAYKRPPGWLETRKVA